MREFPRTRQAVNRAMNALEGSIRAEGRIRTVSGRIFDRMTVMVSAGDGYVEGQLETDDYWRWVGNGRAPGGMPPVGVIQEWVNRTGARVDPWALAKHIAAHGSRAWRRGEKNVFITAIDKWEGSGALDELDATAIDELGNAAIEVVKRIGDG